jgi:hypothetical protein
MLLQDCLCLCPSLSLPLSLPLCMLSSMVVAAPGPAASNREHFNSVQASVVELSQMGAAQLIIAHRRKYERC